ncbi:MAG TPA: ABC transporter substrate-binding protein [Desulfuromonadales bacterium]|nr:ABC transporter substrate-binding protein [Desulfuromonadales bacterium]
MKTKIIAALLLLIVVGIGIRFATHSPSPPAKPVMAAPDYEKYDYGRADETRVIDIGVQPNGIYTGDYLFHDRILRQQLAAEGWTLREHPFRNGKEMVPYCDGRLDVMLLGDIPALVAMNQYPIGIFALHRHGANSIIARRRMIPAELKGLRIGYPPNTTVHFALDRTLQAVNLTLNDITSVPMLTNEMEAALRGNTVDAIATWEPIASTILAIPGTAVVSASEGFTYIAINLEFATRHPHLQKALLAAVVRASKWARTDEQNIRTSLLWTRDAGVTFFGSSLVKVDDMWIGLFRKESIDNPSYPMLPLNFNDDQSIQRQQFEFLKKIGVLPAAADWKTIISRVDTGLLPAIIADSRWQTDRFDYSPDHLYRGKGGTP